LEVKYEGYFLLPVRDSFILSRLENVEAGVEETPPWGMDLPPLCGKGK